MIKTDAFEKGSVAQIIKDRSARAGSNGEICESRFVSVTAFRLAERSFIYRFEKLSDHLMYTQSA